MFCLCPTLIIERLLYAIWLQELDLVLCLRRVMGSEFFHPM